MKLSNLLNYFLCASFVLSSCAGNLSVEAKGLLPPQAADTNLLMAQNNPAGYTPGDTLGSPSNQAGGNAANTSGYSPGDTFGSQSNQIPHRGCCGAKVKLIQDCLNANDSGSPGGYHLAPDGPSTAGTSGGGSSDGSSSNGYHLAPNTPGSMPATQQVRMLLYGDGVSTSKATLELSCGGQTTMILLQTICASGKTKWPWPTRETALKGHIQYQLGLADPQLMNIVQAAAEQDAQGMFSKLTIAPERRLQTMTQLSVWMYESRVTGNPTDAVTPQVMASDICEHSHTSLSALSASDNKELTGHVMDMLMAADETEKHSHVITWQPPAETPPPQLPPPVETTQPGTPPYGGSPPWELVCIPAGTRFFTSDCRYQTALVIRCAYGKCPVCPGDHPTSSSGTPPAASGTGTTDNAGAVPTTALTILPNSQQKNTLRANFLAALERIKQNILNSPKVNTHEGQRLLGAINNLENPTAGVANNLSTGAIGGASNSVVPGTSTALTLPQNFTPAQSINIPGGLGTAAGTGTGSLAAIAMQQVLAAEAAAVAAAAAVVAQQQAAAAALAAALAPGARLQQVQNEAQQVALLADAAATAALGAANLLENDQETVTPVDQQAINDAETAAQAAVQAQQQANYYAQLAQQATTVGQAQRDLKKAEMYEQQAQQDAQQAQADLQHMGIRLNVPNP